MSGPWEETTKLIMSRNTVNYVANDLAIYCSEVQIRVIDFPCHERLQI